MHKKQRIITTRYGDQWNTHWLTEEELKRWLHDHWQEVKGHRRVWLNPFYSRNWDSFWRIIFFIQKIATNDATGWIFDDCGNPPYFPIFLRLSRYNR